MESFQQATFDCERVTSLAACCEIVNQTIKLSSVLGWLLLPIEDDRPLLTKHGVWKMIIRINQAPKYHHYQHHFCCYFQLVGITDNDKLSTVHQHYINMKKSIQANTSLLSFVLWASQRRQNGIPYEWDSWNMYTSTPMNRKRKLSHMISPWISLNHKFSWLNPPNLTMAHMNRLQIAQSFHYHTSWLRTGLHNGFW